MLGAFTAIPEEPEYEHGMASELLYPAFSSVMDYSYQQALPAPFRRKPYAFTVELDPGYKDSNIGFNLPENEIINTFRTNIRGALALIACAGDQFAHFSPAPPPWLSQFAGWDVNNRGNKLPYPKLKPFLRDEERPQPLRSNGDYYHEWVICTVT